MRTEPTATPLYQVRDLTRSFGGREVLNIERLDLDPGKIYGLLGHNGAGKTTLMRLLAFMDTPTSGSIMFQGQEIKPEQAARCRAKVVWVPQSPVLFTGTLLYNIEYPMRLKHLPRNARLEKARELLDMVRLTQLAEAPARRLSGGEAQRASIARALAAGAEVIMFDEPTAQVDWRSRTEIIDLINELWATHGLSIMVTTHDQNLADQLCQEQISLFDGKIATWTRRGEQQPLRADLRAGPSGLTVVLNGRSNGLEQELSVRASIHGLSASPSGVTLRLSAADGQQFEVLIEDPADLELARRMTLQDQVDLVSCQAQGQSVLSG